MVPRLLAAAGIPERYGHCKIANFRVADASASARDQLIQARDTARLYVDDFLQPEGGFRESGLLFIGPPGIGKTHLAVAILVELIEQKRVRGGSSNSPRSSTRSSRPSTPARRSRSARSSTP